jgi:hypothetical protein
MEKQRLQNLVEEFIAEAIKNSDYGNYSWGGGHIEEYLQSTLTEADMQTLDDLLASDDRISYCEVITDDDGFVTIDCNFYLDALESTCRDAVLFNNTMDGEKYYLQYADINGDEEDEYTYDCLLEQAQKLIENDFDISSLDEEFEIEDVSNAFGIRRIIKEIDFQ